MPDSESRVARQGNLVLRLSVGTSGSTVIAEAKLTNEGSSPWEYTVFGTIPPILVRARHESGKDVYRYNPGIQPQMARLTQLDPRKSLDQQFEFSAHGTVFVQAYLSNQESFHTDEIKVDLPESRRRNLPSFRG
jgi:hypothetical protein